MTDLEKFIDTYKQFGIEIKTFVNEKGNTEVILSKLGGWQADRTESDKLDGYSGFYSDLEFTEEGKFLRQGFWE